MSRAQELVGTLDGAASVGIVCHDNPDPDCIASALALREIAGSAGAGAVEILYGGEISHQQNRAFVNLLEIEMVELRNADLDSFDRIAFVDHSAPAANTEFPEGIDVDAVIDHHPSTNGATAGFVDVREDYGATATILVEYVRELDLHLSTEVASALLFALHRERLDYVRNPTRAEYEAALHLYRDVDMELLERLYGSAFSPGTLDAIGMAIQNREVRGSTLVSGIGRTTERDALPQAADYLLNLEGVNTVLVFGIVDDTIRMSARSIDPRVNVGRVLREAFGEIGRAGGHHDMAGAQIPLGLFADEAGDDEALGEFVSLRIKRRFFRSMNLGDGKE